MIFNYVKLSFRLLLRNPFFTFINVAGLAVGFASFFALWQYASLELKTDQYHKDFERIARIGMILQKFSERVTLEWWHYAIPVGLLLFIMFITIASVLFKAARRNPVESLRYE